MDYNVQEQENKEVQWVLLRTQRTGFCVIVITPCYNTFNYAMPKDEAHNYKCISRGYITCSSSNKYSYYGFFFLSKNPPWCLRACSASSKNEKKTADWFWIPYLRHHPLGMINRRTSFRAAAAEPERDWAGWYSGKELRPVCTLT
jgi:hypothetical protein